MTPNKNVLFLPEYAPNLLKIAKGDLVTAEALIQQPPAKAGGMFCMLKHA